MQSLVLIVRQIDRDFVESYQECRSRIEAEQYLLRLRDTYKEANNPENIIEWESHPGHDFLDTVLRINRYRYWIVVVDPI